MNHIKLQDYDLETKAQQQIKGVIQKIATGPELSKDMSREEARVATLAILQGDIDPVRTAIFFIALRMKRETKDENLGILDALKKMSDIQSADVDELVDLADPYNGYKRTIPAVPFLPILLAACGLNCVSHGLNTCSPKFGVTHKQILTAAGIDTDLTPKNAKKKLETDGFSYIDQSQFCPSLHNLVSLRTLAIKRLPITTVEVVIGPIRAKKTHLITGFVHKPYPPVYGALAKESGFSSACLIRGVEGGIIPSLRQDTKIFHYHGDNEEEFDYHPKQINIQQELRAVPLSYGLKIPEDNKKIATIAAKLGLAALAGETGTTFDALLYGASIILHQLGKFNDLKEASKTVGKVLKSGMARDLI